MLFTLPEPCVLSQYSNRPTHNLLSPDMFSRFNANADRGGRSFYENLRSGNGGTGEPQGADNLYDVEERAGLALDEENLNEQFHDYDLEHADGLDIDASRATMDSTAPGAIAGGPVSSAAAAAAAASVAATGVTPGAGKRAPAGKARQGHVNTGHPRWGPSGDDDGDNDDVPGSLLVEPQGAAAEPLPPMLKATPLRSKPTDRRSRGPAGAIPGPATRKNRAQWEATQKQQRLHGDDTGTTAGGGGMRGGFGAPPAPISGRAAAAAGTQPGHALLSYFFTSGGSQKSTAYDRAMWRWVNVSNLDNFIRDVYDYYRDSGIRCILLARLLHLVYVFVEQPLWYSRWLAIWMLLYLSFSSLANLVATRNVAFVAVFLTFLTQCVDYTKIRGSTRMDQILIPQCTKSMSWIWNVGLWLFAFYFIWKTMQFFIFDIRRLFNLRDFFVHLLQIPEHDMQTVSWQDVVVKVMALRDQNPKTATNMTRLQREWIGSQSKERLDAHDIANRLMRRENYLIALFNKDILDLSVPLPFLRNKQLLTRTLEWTLWFGVLDFVFDERGQVNQEFLKSSRRTQLSLMLKSRFLFAGFMNLLLAPFVACYLVVVYFLTYYNVRAFF